MRKASDDKMNEAREKFAALRKGKQDLVSCLTTLSIKLIISFKEMASQENVDCLEKVTSMTINS